MEQGEWRMENGQGESSFGGFPFRAKIEEELVIYSSD